MEVDGVAGELVASAKSSPVDGGLAVTAIRLGDGQPVLRLRILGLLGRFVSLSDVREYKNLATVNFMVTFDDVSRTVANIRPFLLKKQYSICNRPLCQHYRSRLWHTGPFG